VDLRGLVPVKKVNIQDLAGNSIAIDAYNTLYQFLSIIRQPDGTPLKDSTGRVTSHLSGLLYRTTNLMEMGIKPIYVFDGVPPTIKETEIKRRKRIKREAQVKYEKALKKGKLKEARRYVQATSRIKDYMTKDSKRLLDELGVPWIQAPSEGEAQAAHMTRSGNADYCASQDYDSLLFGAPKLVRNMTISGRRKLPRKEVYIEVLPEIIELNWILSEWKITYDQLIDVGILVGTDFNPAGVKGMGPKNSVKVIKKYGSLEAALPHIDNVKFPVDPARIKDIFLNPKTTDDYQIEWKEPNVEGLINFICNERDFSEERVRNTLRRMMKGIEKYKHVTTLEKWFK
jgi:flap endonuclease-1